MAERKTPRSAQNAGTHGTGDGKQPPVFCSFCGRSAEEVLTLVSAPFGGAYICEICTSNHIELLRAHLPQFAGAKKNMRTAGLAKFTPRSIHEALNEYVVEQDQAKKILSVSVYNHFKRIDS